MSWRTGSRWGCWRRAVPRDAVDDAVAAAGKGARRAGGKLPPHVMVYLVMALALFADDDYEEVAARLAETLRGWGGWEEGLGGADVGRDHPGPAAARPRAAGRGVLRRSRCRSRIWTRPGRSWGRWRLMSVDGMEWDVPDTAANRAAFGSPGRPAGGAAAFPKVTGGDRQRVRARMRRWLAAVGPAAGGKGSGEQALARRLYPRPGGGLAAARGPELLLLARTGARRRVPGRRCCGGSGPDVRAAGAGAAAGRVLAVGAGQPAGRSAAAARRDLLAAAARAARTCPRTGPGYVRADRVRGPRPGRRRPGRADHPGHHHHRPPAGPGRRAGPGLPPALGA